MASVTAVMVERLYLTSEKGSSVSLVALFLTQYSLLPNVIFRLCDYLLDQDSLELTECSEKNN